MNKQQDLTDRDTTENKVLTRQRSKTHTVQPNKTHKPRTLGQGDKARREHGHTNAKKETKTTDPDTV